jgi:hypothetical protein
MEEHLLIAVIAASLNILFSILIPPLLTKSKLPFTDEIKKHYECNKKFILISTILIIVLVYISLKVSPFIKSQFLGNISELSKIYEIKIPELPTSVNQQPVAVNQQPVAFNQQPAVVNQQPVAFNQQPAVVNQQPAAVNQGSVFQVAKPRV